MFIRSGSYSGEVTPVPISNTVVKLSSADGSRGFASARVGRRQAIKKTHVLYVGFCNPSIYAWIFIISSYHEDQVVQIHCYYYYYSSFLKALEQHFQLL